MSTRSDQRKDAAEHGLYDPAYEHSMTLAVSVSSPVSKDRPVTKS